MSSTTFTCFCALTIRKHLLKMRFERSGRGQEPSRGHKFSILENVLSIRDFTSAMHLHFRSDLVGVALVGATPLHLACAIPLCRLKAPLGLSLLRKRGLVEKYRAARIYSPWRFLPPRNTPDSFCRLLHPTKSSLRCVGGIFLFHE